MDKKFSVKDISQMLNVSIQTVHFYEKKGVISPKRNPQNNYRQFSRSDLFDLYNAIKYNRLGFTLNEAIKYKNNIGKENTIVDLQNKIKEKRKKIQFEMALCDFMDFVVRESLNAKDKLNKPELIDESIELCYLDVTISLEKLLLEDGDKFRVVSAIGVLYESPLCEDKKSIIYLAKTQDLLKFDIDIDLADALKVLSIKKHVQVYIENDNDKSIDNTIRTLYIYLNKKYKLADKVITFPLLNTEKSQLDSKCSYWKVIFILND